jgi:hypothetical protein
VRTAQSGLESVDNKSPIGKQTLQLESVTLFAHHLLITDIQDVASTAFLVPPKRITVNRQMVWKMLAISKLSRNVVDDSFNFARSSAFWRKASPAFLRSMVAAAKTSVVN